MNARPPRNKPSETCFLPLPRFVLGASQQMARLACAPQCRPQPPPPIPPASRNGPGSKLHTSTIQTGLCSRCRGPVVAAPLHPRSSRARAMAWDIRGGGGDARSSRFARIVEKPTFRKPSMVSAKMVLSFTLFWGDSDTSAISDHCLPGLGHIVWGIIAENGHTVEGSIRLGKVHPALGAKRLGNLTLYAHADNVAARPDEIEGLSREIRFAVKALEQKIARHGRDQSLVSDCPARSEPQYALPPSIDTTSSLNWQRWRGSWAKSPFQIAPVPPLQGEFKGGVRTPASRRRACARGSQGCAQLDSRHPLTHPFDIQFDRGRRPILFGYTGT